MVKIRRSPKPAEPVQREKRRFVVRRSSPPSQPEVVGVYGPDGEQFVRSKYGGEWHKVLEHVPGFVVTGCEHYLSNAEALICPAAGVKKCTSKGCWPELKQEDPGPQRRSRR